MAGIERVFDRVCGRELSRFENDGGTDGCECAM